MWDPYVFDWFEAAAALGYKTCTEIFVLDLAASILRRSWRYSAHTYLGWTLSAVQNFWPKYSRFRKMVAILHWKKSHFCTFLPVYIGYSIVTCLQIWPQTTSTLGNGGHFNHLESHFCTFSPNLFWLFKRNLVGILQGIRGTLSTNLTSNDLDLGKRRPFQGSEIAFLHFLPTTKVQNGMRLFFLVSGL